MRISNKFRNVAYGLTALLLASCNHRQPESTTLIRIPIREEAFLLKDTLSNHMIVDRVVKLESHRSALMGIISQVEWADSLIFIRKQDNSADLLVFSSGGRFLRNICSKGKGPGEAMEFSGFIIDSDCHLVYLQDWANKLIVKDYYGKLVAEYKVPYGASTLIKVDADHLGFAAEGQFLVYLTDLAGKEIKHFMPYEPMFQFGMSHALINTGKEVLYQRYLDDTLYVLNRDTLVPRYLIDFGDRALTREKFLEFPANSMGERKIEGNFMFFPTIFGNSGDQVALSFAYNRHNYMTFIDLATRRSCVFDWSQIKNDPRIRSYMRLCSSTNPDCFIGYVMPDNLDVENIPPMFASAGPIAEDDNPILVFYRFSF